MQTNFSLAQLADPRTAAAEKILRTCVHCGFCTATCPTYVLLGDELDSPRGRIYLIKDMLENDRPATPEVVKHIDRCLSCLSCMSTCPSGVHYMHLVDHARAHIDKTHTRPLADRLMRWTLANILPYRNRFRLALAGAWLANSALALVGLAPARQRSAPRNPGTPPSTANGVLKRMGAMLSLAPTGLAARSAIDTPKTHPATGEKRARVVLMQGCVQPVLKSSINEAALRLLTRMGVEVVIARDEGCCGSLDHHMGREHAGHAHAKRAIDAWIAEMDGAGLDAIVITASGCGTTIKDYGFMFRDDPAYAAKAQRVSAITRDISEFVRDMTLPAPVVAISATVAYHGACSIQHGQQIKDAPKDLLRAAGLTVKEPLESHLCCGSAGVYNILQPDIAVALRDRKIANIARTKPDFVVAGNIGCITQIGKGMEGVERPVPVVHLAEVLDWLTGGPRPAILPDHLGRN